MVGCLVGLREADLVEDDELLQGRPDCTVVF